MTNKKHNKRYEFYDVTQNQLNQLVALGDSDNKGTGLPKTTEVQVVRDAVAYYHASKFGKDIINEEINKLEVVLTNTINLVLKNYFEQFASALNHLNFNDEIIKEAILLIIKGNEIIPSDERVALSILGDGNIYREIFEKHVERMINE